MKWKEIKDEREQEKHEKKIRLGIRFRFIALLLAILSKAQQNVVERNLTLLLILITKKTALWSAQLIQVGGLGS